MSEQAEHLERVSARIRHAVVAFVASVEAFHMRELVAHVEACVPGTAPDSASRVLRAMRRRGVVDYDVVDRRASHYVVRRPAKTLV